jgi:hypothetical protein
MPVTRGAIAAQITQRPDVNRSNSQADSAGSCRSREWPAARGTHGIERVGLARPVPVLAVSAAGLNNPDTGGCHVPGQARAVASGSLDADQAHGPEPAQPAQQPGITGCRGRELLHAE